MKYRTTHLLAEKTMSGSGTEVIDVKVKQPISRIIIAWRVTMAGHGMNGYPHLDIPKIELVDGSDVLHSLDGGENQALCIYDRKVGTMNHGQWLNACSGYSTYGIDFGRFLHDPLLALDPEKFTNLQLKISYNVALMDTGASTAYLEVWAEVFDEKVITPIGFLMAKEHYSWSLSAAGAYEYIQLPTDHPFRKMLIQGYKIGIEPWYQVIEARLDEDNESKIPFDWDLEDYHRVRKGMKPMVEEQLIGVAKTDSSNVFYVTPTDYYSVFSGIGVNSAYFSTGTWQKGGKFTPVSSSGDLFFMAMVHGWLPNHCFEFPFGDPQDIEDWYDVTKLGSLRLRLKSGSGTSGDVNAILQQLRRY